MCLPMPTPLSLLNFHVWNVHRWRKSGKGLTGQSSVCRRVCQCQPSLAYWGMLEVWGTCAIYVGIPSQILANEWDLRQSMWAFPAWFWQMSGTCATYVPLLSQWLNFKLFFYWVRALRNSFSDIDGATHFLDPSKNLVEFKRGLCHFC